MPHKPLTTAPAFLLPRAATSTCCFHSIGQNGENTLWQPVTYDPIVPYITSVPGFPFWIDWCSTAWCNTATMGTSCGAGTIRGISLSASCERCVTETMYQKMGDATPKLNKIFCHGDWVGRTYYIEEPPARRQAVSTSSPNSSIATTTTTTTVTSSPPSISSTPSPGSASTSQPAQTNAPATSSSTVSPGIIAGSTIGGVVILGIIGLLIFYIYKTKKKTAATAAATESVGTPVPETYSQHAQYHAAPTNEKYLFTTAHVSELPGHEVPMSRHELPGERRRMQLE
ncbi:hypothetical protein B0J11DRAFT_582981 [Dendryphion nanum]|uniref:Uncharacterized protein n=1 Tax=Dendryphion nanum TaxID=256645 RepID=A0A9P9DEQ1_9PLEO|nr:hypothetical protein B0J11DRAFT_582981 [Dendryphion nanum]